MKKEKINEDGIYKRLQDDLTNFDMDVNISENNDFNFSDTLNLIELYLSSKFESGDKDSQGNKKFFYNLIIPQCGHATKNIDLDRKEIRVKTTQKKDDIKATLYSAELKQWMRDNNFGQLLNKVSDNLPKYGSVVLKKVGDKVIYTPLKYLRFEPALSNSPNNYDIQSSYIIERHVFQPLELQEMITRGWDEDKVNELIDNSMENNNTEIVVHEYYSIFKNKDLGIKGKGITKGVAFIGEVKSKTLLNDRQTETVSGVCLYSDKLEKFPYKKLDYFTIEGRNLGRGITETLFDIQERWNGMANDKALSMRIGNKQIFQSGDSNAGGNILTDLLNGDIIDAEKPIMRIPTEERNLGAYGQEENNMLYHVRSLSNAQEIITGDNLPSRTPFRTASMQLQQASKLFSVIRQNESMFLEELIIEWILPNFDKSLMMEHVFTLYDPEDMAKIVERDVNRRLNIAIKQHMLMTGYFPEKAQLEIIKAQLTSASLTEDKKFVKIIEGLMKFSKNLEVDISGEQRDVAAEVETGINFIQLLAQNPQIKEDPDLMKMLNGIATQSGIDPLSLPSATPAPVPSTNEMGTGSLGAGAALPNGSMPQ